jgi:hypothetical protein
MREWRSDGIQKERLALQIQIASVICILRCAGSATGDALREGPQTTAKGRRSRGPTFIPALLAPVYDCGGDANPTRADGRVLAMRAHADVNEALPLNGRARADGDRRECADAHELRPRARGDDDASPGARPTLHRS